MKIEFSFRYGVMGVYIDRTGTAIRFYPIPFVRITFGDDR
jgi:hypothetical protein